MADETYDPARIEGLREMLKALAQRILQLDTEGRLLLETPALLKELGDVRAELFQYEVRVTYDTPEIAEHRRIVGEASGEWVPDDETDTDEDEPWQPDR